MLSLKKNVEFEKDMVFGMSPMSIFWGNFSELWRTYEFVVCTTRCVQKRLQYIYGWIGQSQPSRFWRGSNLTSSQTLERPKFVSISEKFATRGSQRKYPRFSSNICSRNLSKNKTHGRKMGQKFHSLTRFLCTLCRPNNEGWQLLGCKVITVLREKCNPEISLHVLITSGVYLAYFEPSSEDGWAK